MKTHASGRRPGHRPVASEIVERAREMRRQGMQIKEIWEALGRTTSIPTLTKYLRGIPAPKRVTNIARDERIIEQLRSGAKMAKVAHDEGITRARVGQIVEAYERRTGETVERYAWKKPKPTPPRKRSSVQRMLERAVLNPETGCWHWKGYVYRTDTGDEYPVFTSIEKTAGSAYVRRASYRLWRGEIPDKHLVVPRCSDTVCINPFHLEAVSVAARLRQSDSWDHERDTWRHSRKKGEPLIRKARPG